MLPQVPETLSYLGTNGVLPLGLFRQLGSDIPLLPVGAPPLISYLLKVLCPTFWDQEKSISRGLPQSVSKDGQDK